MWYSGEFHPFRLPVPSLWFDVFQKIKALGYNGVSFYTDWAVLEGKEGEYIADGVFALEPFLEAAAQAGLYLNARPGPYINAEASGGGFPGWLQRIKAHLRTRDPEYLNATQNYLQSVTETIAKYQITEGGAGMLLHSHSCTNRPSSYRFGNLLTTTTVILFQPENEYDIANVDDQYMQDVEDQFRNAGIVVPFMSNDNGANGVNAPGTGLGEVDIYGQDSYPLGFDCAHPYTWPDGALPTYFLAAHEEQSPTTPYSVPEFQGGSFDPWGGPGFENCATLLNEEFERVFYKNQFAVDIALFNLYMVYGGTNWGNLGQPGKDGPETSILAGREKLTFG